MKAPSAPSKIIWYTGLITGILGIAGHYVDIPVITENNYVILLVGFVCLAIGTSFRNI